MGNYLNKHFVSAFQRVGTFRVSGQQKQGGNVAAYFCTADGNVLHAIAGPVDEDTFLREARWVVHSVNLARLENRTGPGPSLHFFRKAHFDRLLNEHGVHQSQIRVSGNLTVQNLGNVLNWNMVASNQGKVHLLLGLAPLVRIEQIHQTVFERILNERVSLDPVNVAGK